MQESSNRGSPPCMDPHPLAFSGISLMGSSDFSPFGGSLPAFVPPPPPYPYLTQVRAQPPPDDLRMESLGRPSSEYRSELWPLAAAQLDQLVFESQFSQRASAQSPTSHSRPIVSLSLVASTSTPTRHRSRRSPTPAPLPRASSRCQAARASHASASSRERTRTSTARCMISKLGEVTRSWFPSP